MKCDIDLSHLYKNLDKFNVDFVAKTWKMKYTNKLVIEIKAHALVAAVMANWIKQVCGDTGFDFVLKIKSMKATETNER